MLGQARARFAAKEAGRVSILAPLGSAELTSKVLPGSADVVTAIQCHHYLQEAARLQALQACFITLKPGGLFVTFENIAPRTGAGVRFGLAGWKSFLMNSGWTAAEADKHLARYGRELLPITVERHLAALMKTGFAVVEIFWYSQMQAGFYAIK
jgi:tRNA (cmo5U34)-methyltransferase